MLDHIRRVKAGFGRVMISRDKIWLHFAGEEGGIEDELVMSVDEAEAVISTLRNLVDQHRAQLAPEAKA